ncbi:MAG: Nif3-like dinuclear metal center hexameric protein [Bifidobacteriaceae bacterium]|jgi:dinuclear metal center YbgI/SA1388 family protein|nr:Nif3-like dinuclear metal center hexameric protein [Bifidobacteriaceae bacterium]
MGNMKLKEAVDRINALYPVELSEDWDYPGLIVGDINSVVEKVYLTCDITHTVIEDAIEKQADLIFAHHPLFFRPVHAISGFTHRGNFVNMLIKHDIALYSGHTNADSAKNGVADAFAASLKLQNTKPILPFTEDSALGLGRIGYLPNEITLYELATTLKTISKPTEQGIKVAGDKNAKVRKVAVLPGDAKSALKIVKDLNPDVYITSDLTHHAVQDLVEEVTYLTSIDARHSPTPYLIDITHSAAESIWLQVAKHDLSSALDVSTDCIFISDINTDPWTFSI